MYDQFKWTNVSARRNLLTMEYEPLQPFFLLALAEKAGCGTFLDVGANVGAYSLFATLVPGIEQVVAFEANPDTRAELEDNVALNGLASRIDVQGKAVSSAPGTISFGVVSAFSGANSVVETSIHDRSTFHKQIDVQAVALDQIFSTPMARPICIKVDVEGHEAAVIDGASRMLKANGAVIQMEGYGDGGGEVLGRLEALGYRRLTQVGPDHYLSNLELFRDAAEVIGVYEQAAGQLIAYNHRNKAIMLKRGDFGLHLTGRTADAAREIARRFIGKRL